MSVLNIDCIEGMRMFHDGAFDAIVCDPPYELGFMGKSWDASGIAYNVDMWREALRVLKPGGHLLAFSGSRTYHRMTCAIEDAGFEVRDQIMWVYGSGFPKSLDVSKAIDKAAGAERSGTGEMMRAGCRAARGGEELVGGESVEAAKWKELTAPATDAAHQWEGWGTALKPAHEPICVARKPLVGTVAANVLEFGTGAINIDGCRVEGESTRRVNTAANSFMSGEIGGVQSKGDAYQTGSDAGRWPANLIHDGSPEVVALFPEGRSAGIYPSNSTARDGVTSFSGKQGQLYNDTGSAARFFYCAKASKRDRDDGNTHPTVKPTDLMRYLCRLVTPPGGMILDPFAGSGSTGKAAKLEGFDFIGFELSAEYTEIANARIAAVCYATDNPVNTKS